MENYMTPTSKYDLTKMVNLQELDKLKELFDKIEDIYYTNYGTQRDELLKLAIMDLLKIIDVNLQNSNQLDKTEISFLYLVKSLSLDKLPEYSKQAEESASKSLKLNPFVADNYNCIAHIMWKKQDIIQAIKYFEKALELEANNINSLRSLSMIIRTKDTVLKEEKLEIAKKSLEYANQAIKLYLQDSMSWYVYGNAYFYKAFVDKTQYNDLNLALNSYNKSQEKGSKYKNPDLYYNRGVVHAYLENYEQAYDDFNNATLIDQTLNSKAICANISHIVSQACKLVKNQCGLKATKLAQIIATIPINIKDDIAYKLAHSSELVEGSNKGRLITGKFIQAIESSFDVPISIACVDYSGEFHCLSMYNFSKDFVQTLNFTTSTFVLLNPELKKIKMTLDGKVYEYPCLQVSEPQNLLVDGKYCSGFASSATLNSKFFN